MCKTLLFCFSETKKAPRKRRRPKMLLRFSVLRKKRYACPNTSSVHGKIEKAFYANCFPGTKELFRNKNRLLSTIVFYVAITAYHNHPVFARCFCDFDSACTILSNCCAQRMVGRRAVSLYLLLPKKQCGCHEIAKICHEMKKGAYLLPQLIVLALLKKSGFYRQCH